MEMESMEPSAAMAAASLAAMAAAGLAGFLALGALALYVLGPLKNGARCQRRGQRQRRFYGEDWRHARKAADAFNGVRLVLKTPIDVAAVRARILRMLEAEGPESLLRVHMVSATEYFFSDATDEEVAALLLHETESGNDDPAASEALSADMWARGLPLRIFVYGKTLDLMAHHAVFDGVRGIRLLNELLGNLHCKGTIRPDALPCCLLASRAGALARVVAVDRPAGVLGLRTQGTAHHESHYIRVPAAAIKALKQTHGLGFAPGLQGLILWALFRCNVGSTLHVASTVGFKSDFWARLGSAFNHYGAFPIAVKDSAAPQGVAKSVAKAQKRTGMSSGFPCLLANASCGGAASSIGELYKAIDVLIGGGPLVLDEACGYDFYRIYKFHHTVPIYILYVTICDQIDVSIHSRVPLPGLQAAFEEGLARMSEAKAEKSLRSSKSLSTITSSLGGGSGAFAE